MDFQTFMMKSNVSRDDSKALSRSLLVAYTFIYVLLLPVFIFIVAVGFQQCRKPRSQAPTATHSDVFTFNIAALEVFGVISCCFFVHSFTTGRDLNVGESLSFMTTFGQTALHLLVCAERFVAVVHPVTYLHLKGKAVTARNASIVVVWLLSCGVASFRQLSPDFSLYFVLTTGLLSLTAIIYFCGSVLFVLIRPGPGERGGDGRQLDQTKRRAFHTIAAIMVALLLKFGTMFVSLIVRLTNVLSQSQIYLMSVSAQWFSISSSLVMPLLFLYRRFKQRKTSNK